MASAESKKAVRITQQFRERQGMTYELDCSGASLIVRVFLLGEDVDSSAPRPVEEWRVDVRSSNAEDAVVATGTAPSRALAFDLAAQQWRENAPAQSLGSFDWPAIAQAMTAVRAL